jgi:hypothetical protein
LPWNQAYNRGMASKTTRLSAADAIAQLLDDAGFERLVDERKAKPALTSSVQNR